MGKQTIPTAPKGSGPRGRAAWRALHRAFEFEDRHHLEMLVELVRCVDRIESYEQILGREGLVVEGRYGPKSHPAAIDQRATQGLLVKLCQALDLPTDPSEWDGLSTSQRGRKAAMRRVARVSGPRRRAPVSDWQDLCVKVARRLIGLGAD